MKLYCLRHGETVYNRLELCNDDPGRDVRLTPEGIRQAEAAAERLRAAPVERIITSELPRTRQTADIINRYHHAPVQSHPALNDIRSGFESRPVAEYFAATGHDRLHIRVNGGESLLDYKTPRIGIHRLAGRPARGDPADRGARGDAAGVHRLFQGITRRRPAGVALRQLRADRIHARPAVLSRRPPTLLVAGKLENSTRIYCGAGPILK